MLGRPDFHLLLHGHNARNGSRLLRAAVSMIVRHGEIVERSGPWHTMIRRMSDLLVHLTMGYLALAAAGKLADLGLFLDQLGLLGLPPRSLRW